MIAGLSAVSMTNWICVGFLAGATAIQSAAPPPDVARVIRDVANGQRPIDAVRLDSECVDEGRFETSAVYGSGVAIWNSQRHGTVTPQQVRTLLDLFVRENFAKMPASFGEDEGEEDTRHASVKMTCRVRFSDDAVEKSVMQLEKGRQSAALKRLAHAVLAASRTATADARPIGSLEDALGAIGGGRMPVETLRITMRAGAGSGVRQAAANGYVLRLDGRDLEIDPDAGPRSVRRLDPAEVRDVVRALWSAGFAGLPASVNADDYLDVTVSVLGQEHAVQARPLPDRAAAESDAQKRFTTAVAPLMALRRR
jgi:hypothetical protein